MNQDSYYMLDNPVWHALQSEHKHFALGTDTIRRYQPGILQILGSKDPATASLSEIEPWVSQGEQLFMVGELAPIPVNWSIKNRLDCTQMVCPEPVATASKINAEIITLTKNDHAEMLELITMVQPGYFYINTPLLGNYIGIRQGKQLVAVAGERLRMTGFTEISAVITHPLFTGNGFAKQLVGYLSQKNIDNGCLPFLHVSVNNTHAEKIYETIGFRKRRTIAFWEIGYERYT